MTCKLRPYHCFAPKLCFPIPMLARWSDLALLVWLMLIYRVRVKSLPVIWKGTADSWYSHHSAPGVAACAKTHLSHSWALFSDTDHATCLWFFQSTFSLFLRQTSTAMLLALCLFFISFPNTSRGRVAICILIACCHIRFNGVQSYVSSENCYFTGVNWHQLQLCQLLSRHKPEENVPTSPQFWAASFFAIDTFATHYPDTQFTEHVVLLLVDHRSLAEHGDLLEGHPQMAKCISTKPIHKGHMKL